MDLLILFSQPQAQVEPSMPFRSFKPSPLPSSAFLLIFPSLTSSFTWVFPLQLCMEGSQCQRMAAKPKEL